MTERMVAITEAEIDAAARRAVRAIHEARESFTVSEFVAGTDEAVVSIVWRAAIRAELQALRALARVEEG